MRKIILVLAAVVAVTPASAQDRKPPPPQGVNGKTLDMCKPDAQKFCDGKALQQECLVRNWTKISSDCQDALATPMRGGGGG